MTDAGAERPVASSAYPGRPRIRGVSSYEYRPLDDAWTRCSFPAGTVKDPSALAAVAPEWEMAVVPGTVAEAMRRSAPLDLEQAPDFDARDWWYRCRFAGAPPNTGGERNVLCCEGLATIADVWLNGQHVLASDDMFIGHEIDVTALLRADNEILIRFASLRAALEARRPRPRWRTKLVEHQQLRWHRTTLLGRMPGWSPPVRAVGPWRGIRIERRNVLEVRGGDLYAVGETQGGSVDVALDIAVPGGTSVRGAAVHVGEWSAPLTVSVGGDGAHALRGVLRVPGAEHWWPHTHGAQPHYDARVTIDTNAGVVTISLGPVAFRRVTMDLSNGGFAVLVNDTPVFCRGACWTTPDIVTLTASDQEYRELLTLARDAGMNMLRIGGTMVYEADVFYDICDELGILVWQEFMFANMDYPAGDSQFAATVGREAEGVVARLRRHPSLALFCGNSEVEQQAAMLGLEADRWSNSIFRELLPLACAAGAPGVPYWPASPSGGALPFHADSGVAHYFGVGAYLRPLEDARRSNVRFTSECLGFSNVPDQRMVDAVLPNGEAPFHHPRWKSRVPRDHGAGWDFEDVRDHYLARLFGVDPMQVRYAEMDRYLALSRVLTGEIMAQTIGEWRRSSSTCRGAIVWFFQDLWAGAGWGVVDAAGRPKAAYYALKRAMQPVAVSMTDEGANGLHVHIANDTQDVVDGELTVTLLRGGATVTAAERSPVRIPARGGISVTVDQVLKVFRDAAYAYRFGPPGHDVVVATLRDSAAKTLGEAMHFPDRMPTARTTHPIIEGSAARLADHTVAITLHAEHFAQFIAIDGGDFVLDDNYFHMMPGSHRTILARARKSGARFDGFAQALNAYEGVHLPLVVPQSSQ